MIQKLGGRLLRQLRQLWRSEDGTATIEFTFCLPIVMTIFMASVEGGYYMIRHVMLERGLDMVMRDFRIGRLKELSHDEIRERVCDATPVIMSCDSKLKVWIEPIDTATWAVNTQMQFCGDRNGTLRGPDTGTVIHGEPNEAMYVRVCILQNPIFPSTGLGLRLRADSLTGGYQLATATVVVNEPRT